MGLSHKHIWSKIPAKINTYMLTRTELLITLCYEIPCSTWYNRKLWLYTESHTLLSKHMASHYIKSFFASGVSVGHIISCLYNFFLIENKSIKKLTWTSLNTFLTPSRVVHTMGFMTSVSGVSLKATISVTKGCIQWIPGCVTSSIKAPYL